MKNAIISNDETLDRLIHVQVQVVKNVVEEEVIEDHAVEELVHGQNFKGCADLRLGVEDVAALKNAVYKKII
jgi:hypothetical protein